MPRRQVIVQLDDDLVAALDKVASEEGVSRSELLRRGAAAVLEARRIMAEERKQVESYRLRPQEPALLEASLQLAAETAPPS